MSKTQIVLIVIISLVILFLVYQYTKNTPRPFSIKDLMEAAVLFPTEPISKNPTNGNNNNNNNGNNLEGEQG